MSIQETIDRLMDLWTLAKEVTSEEMTEVYLLPIKREDAEMFRNTAQLIRVARDIVG